MGIFCDSRKSNSSLMKENKHDTLIAPKIISIYKNMHHTDELAQKVGR